MSKGSVIIVAGFLTAFLPFTGFPTFFKMALAVLLGLLLMAFGFLVRQERMWLLRAMSGEHKTDAYTENGAPLASHTSSQKV
ncbi:hypothetical protein EPO56_02495 [Patescibacteria group bacterium]|nr:MAG: hypothetical protein EPO56_02495 [Patescibacteria group bacterium]